VAPRRRHANVDSTGEPERARGVSLCPVFQTLDIEVLPGAKYARW
jgi:hypothetical protein